MSNDLIPTIGGELERPKKTKDVLAPVILTFDRELAMLNEFIARAGKTAICEKLPGTPGMGAAMLHLMDKLNRRLDEREVRQFIDIFKRGDFFPESEWFQFDWDGAFRNGQHRASALVRSGVTVPYIWVIFGMDPKTFNTIDVGRKRNASQALELMGIKNGAMRAAATRLYLRTEHNGVLPDEQLVINTAIEDNDEYMEASVHDGNRIRKANKSSGSSATLAMWFIRRYTQRRLRIDEFVDRLCLGDQLALNNPIYWLRRQFERSGGVKVKAQYLAQTRHCAWIILAWNAWSSGKHHRSYNFLDWEEKNELPKVL